MTSPQKETKLESALMPLTTQNKGTWSAWRALLWAFSKREWASIFVWSALGVAAEAVTHLVLLDHSFQQFFAAKYIPSRALDNPRLYLPDLTMAAIALLLAVALSFPVFVRRGLRSWLAGVTSGLPLLSFVVAFAAVTLHIPHIAIAIPGMLCAFFILSFMLFMNGKAHAEDVPSEEDLRVPTHARSLARTQLTESDDPIRTWTEDALCRASLIDSMTVKLLISKSPVLALFGEFGSGKTSVLNLLREHLAGKAIVVSFSTWLPGSQDTLTSYLLNDIASECQKEYVVPGMRKSAQRLANALGRTVPLLKSYLESLPAATQKDDINGLKEALARLPKRVIVLLDELDRMEKDELVTLLKIIRGVSALPNLSFVCAGNRTTIVETVRDKFNDQGNIYFEKFFPVSIQIPETDPVALRKAGTERLVSALNRRDWFEQESDSTAFRERIEILWGPVIAPFCRNLRAVGLLANDVGAAAALLKREVDPVDLTLIELLRRFKPDIYDLVAGNSVVLTGGESILRGGSMQLDKEKESAEQKFLTDMRKAVSDDEFQKVKDVLSELFPAFRKIANTEPLALRPNRQESERETSKSISEPGMFPAYFRYQVPEAMFSSVEMDALLRRIGSAVNDDDRDRVFVQTLDSMEKGSLKRDDFLRKLAEVSTKSLPVQQGKALVHAAMKSAHKYVYDTFPAFGEAGHVLRLVIRITDRIPVAERVRFLSQCIQEAGDDTMALRIVQRLPGKHTDFDLQVDIAQLYPSFRFRMKARYGPDVDASTIDLSSSDPWAFDLWGRTNIEGVTTDPEDRRVQYSFWKRYIGNSRSRLASAFRGFLLPVAAYSGDAAPAVENKIPIADLKVLYEQLPDNGSLTDADRLSLGTLRRLLDGEFKNGAGPDLYR